MRGVLYSVIKGHPIYLEWAAFSAGTVKKVMLDVRIGIYTNMIKEAEQLGCFDDIWQAPQEVAKEDWQGMYIEAMIRCSYHPTLFLGADCVVCEDLRPLMELMETGKFDLALTLQDARRSLPFPPRGVPAAFPHYSDGIMVFPRNETMTAFLRDWQDRFNDHKVMCKKYRKHEDGMHPPQETLREALYFNSHLRLVVLQEEYNEPFWTGCVHGRVKVLHIHGARPEKAWKLAQRLNANTDRPRLFRNREIIE